MTEGWSLPRREAWLTALGIFAVALVVRVLTASIIGFPKPEDTAYYVGAARNLVEGRGLVSNALWSYGTPPLVFPRPAFEVWLPLPSLLAAIPIALFGGPAPISLGAAMRAAQVIPVLAGAVLSVLAWRLAADVAAERGLPAGRARSLAIGAGLASAVYLPLLLHAALPDSTMLFGTLVLGACLLMTRVLADPRGAPWSDPRLIGTGLLIGAAALTRNEAVWLAAVWAWLAWRRQGEPRAVRGRLIAVVAVVSLLVFAPWAVRNWAVFGNPLPGQAISNALSVAGFDIFAWNDPPTLSRYLSQGPQALLEARVSGVAHNLFNVLLLLGIPISVLGLLALPWQGRDRALRPILLVSVITFLVTSLLFPVATTWGTFLHAAAPFHVLLLISALGALDGGFARLGRRLGWTRQVAWLGGLLAIFASSVFSAALLPSFGSGARATERTYEVLARQMAVIGAPLDDSAPVIHDFPIWLAETARVRSLALPDETPADVLDLANAFGATWLITSPGEHGSWPAVLDGPDPDASCFEEVLLPIPDDPLDAAAIDGIRVFRIECRGVARTGSTDPAARLSPEAPAPIHSR
ncbi:MAG TPA: hypothetical protein VGK16_00665 [Candidatus Limnocylindrales bacterium]